MQSPESSLTELDLIVRAIPPVGNVLPVQVAVTNVTTKSMRLDASHIQGRSASGAMVDVLSPDQAKEAAGGAEKLMDALSQVYLVHREGREKAPSRAALVAQACLAPLTPSPGSSPSPELGAAWIMFVCPLIITGGIVKSVAVASSHSLQVDDAALPDNGLESGIETQGYIFFPVGKYTSIEVPVIDYGTGGTEIVVQSWNSEAELANTVAVSGPAQDSASRESK